MGKFLVVFSAALASCTLDEPPTTGELRLSLVNANAEAGASDGETPAEAGREFMRLYLEFAARLYEGGVTPEEMQAAVDAGDAVRVRELFGYTAEEFEDANERAQVVSAKIVAVMDTSEDRGHTEGLECDWEILQCGLGPALYVLSNPAVGAGVLVVTAIVCTAAQCRWDDGPRTKQP